MRKIKLVLVLSLLVFTLCSCGKEDKDSKSSGSNSNGSNSNGSSSQNSAEDSEEKVATIGLGEVGTYEDLAITIDGVTTPNPEALSGQPESGMKFILLQITSKNEGSEELTGPSANDFTIQIEGENYYYDRMSVYLPEGDKNGGDPIASGESHTFEPLYQVPEGTTDYTVLYVPGFSGAELTYEFSVTE